MKKTTITRYTNKKMRQLRHVSPTILSSIAVIGLVASIGTSIKITPKALAIIQEDSRNRHDGDPCAYTTKEAILSAWKCYIPVAIIGMATVSCILGANAINKKQQASLVAAYMMLDKSYREYKKKVVELFGEDGAVWVRDELIKDKYDKDAMQMEDDKQLFYLDLAGYFQSTSGDVQDAFYHFNRNFVLRGAADLNELLCFLGLEPVEQGDVLGWSFDEGVYYGYEWVDYYLDQVRMDDGLECTVIYLPFSPSYIYGDPDGDKDE